ncbi:MAG: tryptophan 7-halogenase [Chloroflexota bacterium]
MVIETGNKYDVIILGTGMAGTIVGAILARQGVSVLLIDAKVHPRFAVGESTIPHTSLLLSLLAERYGVPDIEHIAFPDRIARYVCSSCGIKRSFGFAYHRPGQVYDPREGLQFGTSSKDENHLFRQDIDAYLLYVAVHYGAAVRQNTKVTEIAIDQQGVTLQTAVGEAFHAQYLVDGTGYESQLAQRYNLREKPTSLKHHSRTLFTHMIDVKPFQEGDNPLSLSWHQSTLHHVFERGWFWVIPFNNQPLSTNPLISVGLTIDPRRYPKPDMPPEREFQQFLDCFPSVAEQLKEAKTVRPWVSTGRLQYSSTRCTGYRFCLMSHAAGAVDPLFSRGLINTSELILALLDPLLAALQDGDFADERFRHLECRQRRVLAYNDRLVNCAFTSWADFDLWNAWLRVWALGTILTEYRLMNALADYTTTRDPACLQGEANNPVFSEFEDPDYAVFFNRAAALMESFEAGWERSPDQARAGETAEQIFALTGEYEFPVPLRREAMRRAGWLAEDKDISDRNIEAARRGYRWALTNPTSRDLFGNVHAFYRWRSQEPDPHLGV